jgi:hypothetical protein
VLLETLTGERVFPGTTAETLGARLISQPAIPGSLGPAWTALLAGMTALEPTERIDALEVALAARGIADAVDERLDDTLDRTLVYPVNPTAATEVFRSTAHDEAPMTIEPTHDRVVAPPVAAPSHPSTPGRSAERRMRNTVIGIAVAIVIAAGIGIGTLLTATGGAAAPTPSYPPVDGILGTHLQQLQDSVAP